jgi:hypothetical protein
MFSGIAVPILEELDTTLAGQNTCLRREGSLAREAIVNQRVALFPKSRLDGPRYPQNDWVD